MKLSKTIVLPLAAAALVVVGTGAVLAATAPSSPSASGAAVLAATSPAPAPAASTAPVAPYLKSVLDGLVSKGTITGAQEQAIVDAWVAGRTDIRAGRQQLRAFLSDGVLTADELAQLPPSSPFQQLKPLMKNGQLSIADIRAIGQGIMRELRMGGMGTRASGQGMRPGAVRGLGGVIPAPSASPAVGS